MKARTRLAFAGALMTALTISGPDAALADELDPPEWVDELTGQTPSSEPDPEPEPEPAPEPDPGPDPGPEPAPEPEPDPEPTVEPPVDPGDEGTSSEPAPSTAPEPIVDGAGDGTIEGSPSASPEGTQTASPEIGRVLDGSSGPTSATRSGLVSSDGVDSSGSTILADGGDADDVAASGDQVDEADGSPAWCAAGEAMCVRSAPAAGWLGRLFDDGAVAGEFVTLVAGVLPATGTDLLNLIGIAILLGLVGALAIRPRSRRALAPTSNAHDDG
jgi:hypothetical protein